MDYPAGTLIYHTYLDPIQGSTTDVGVLLRADLVRASYIVLWNGKETEWLALFCEEQV
jgi:hypothetical protein